MRNSGGRERHKVAREPCQKPWVLVGRKGKGPVFRGAALVVEMVDGR